jgi:hypothetical protein
LVGLIENDTDLEDLKEFKGAFQRDEVMEFKILN